MCHRTKFRHNRPNGFGDIIIFRYSRWPPSAILDFLFLNFWSPVTRPNVHRHAKFHQNWSNGCGDIAFFQNGGRLPSWIF